MPGPAATIWARPMAQKTGEFRGGIGGLLAAGGDVPELVRALSRSGRGAANRPGELRSIRVRRRWRGRLLRPQDRIELVELHGTDHAALAAWTARGSTVRREDGLAALVAPHAAARAPRGGADRPQLRAQDRLPGRARGAGAAYRRFAAGTFLLWYPVIERARTERCWPPWGDRHRAAVPPRARPAAGRAGPRHDRVRAGRDQSGLDSARSGEPRCPGSPASCGATGPRRAEWLVPPPGLEILPSK